MVVSICWASFTMFMMALLAQMAKHLFNWHRGVNIGCEVGHHNICVVDERVVMLLGLCSIG